jgi:regulatory protein
MATITKIAEQRRNPNRRNIHIDGKFAFGCNLNVVARFRLQEDQHLTAEQIREIEQGEVRQECFDAGLHFLQSRLHSRSELYRKLMRKEWGESVVETVLDELTRLGYVNDERFAKTKALSAVEHKHQGRRRAFMELIRSGVNGDVATRACNDIYGQTDSNAIVRELALKQAPRLSKLDPVVAKRRLVGFLTRRGFDYDTIRPVIDEVLGAAAAGR